MSLKDLVAIKLRTGLQHVHRRMDLVDARELISRVPPDETCATRLPEGLRPDFGRLVDVVRAGEKLRDGEPHF